MFDRKKAIICTVCLYVIGVCSSFPVLAQPKVITPFTVLAPLSLVIAIVLTVLCVKLKKKDPAKEYARKAKRLTRLSQKYNSGNPEGIGVKRVGKGEFIFVGTLHFGELGKIRGELVSLDFENFYKYEKRSKDAERRYVLEIVQQIQDEILTYSHKIINYFLYQALSEMYDTANDAWLGYRKLKNQHKDIISDEPSKDEGEYTDEQCREIFECVMENFNPDAEFELYLEGGLASDELTDTEQFIKEKLEFFDVDKLISGITLENVCINERLEFSIQLSDETQEIFCGAYEQFNDELYPTDWHNF